VRQFGPRASSRTVTSVPGDHKRPSSDASPTGDYRSDRRRDRRSGLEATPSPPVATRFRSAKTASSDFARSRFRRSREAPWKLEHHQDHRRRALFEDRTRRRIQSIVVRRRRLRSCSVACWCALAQTGFGPTGSRCGRRNAAAAAAAGFRRTDMKRITLAAGCWAPSSAVRAPRR
jgi:hypothetical protein